MDELELTKSVKEKLKRLSEQKESYEFNPALKNALRLSDIYDYITPEPYILPIDALAGIPIKSKTGR